MAGRNTGERILENQNFDVFEDLQETNIMYIGFLEAGTTEQDENNCMIMKIEKIGNITTRKYAKGINYEKSCTWSERANLDYKFKLKNL